MRKVTFLVGFLCIISTYVHAQTDKQFNFNSPEYQDIIRKEKQHFKDFNREFYTGLGVTTGGLALSTLPLFVEMDKGTRKFAQGFGAAVSATGIIITFFAHYDHIGYLKQSRIKLQGNGIAINLD